MLKNRLLEFIQLNELDLRGYLNTFLLKAFEPTVK